MHRPGFEKSLIFIIDDQQYVADSVREIIEVYFRCEVRTFTNDQFFQEIDVTKVDLFIMDNIIPGYKNGVVLGSEISKINDAPILFVSGYPFVENMYSDELSRIIIYDFIPKPFHAEHLADRIGLLLKMGAHMKKLNRDRTVLETEFWEILNRVSGIYVIICYQDGTFINTNKQFATDIGINSIHELARMQLKFTELTGDLEITEKRSEKTSALKNIFGTTVAIVKWFAWMVGDHKVLLGIPIARSLDCLEDLHDYYRTIINTDKVFVDFLMERLRNE